MISKQHDLCNDKKSGLLFFAVAVLVIALVPLQFLTAKNEQERWEIFSIVHNCKKIQHVDGNTETGVGYGMTAKGNIGLMLIMFPTPSKTGYLCDDGVTYWRWP